MDIGILGLGLVGRSFADMLPEYGHSLYVFDTNPVLMHDLPNGAYACGCEEEVGEASDFLLCCTDMLSGSALTKAAKAMRPGGVVSGDFSAKTPEYGAFIASGRQDSLAYYTIHTMFSPKLGFQDGLTLEIPVRGCVGADGFNPYITEFRNTLRNAGTNTKTLWSVKNHDLRMGRIQGVVSAENICTALTLAELCINPLSGEGIYSGEMDKVKFLMALRAIGPEGSSNHRVYSLIAMMNPYSLANINAYAAALEKLITAAEKSERDANGMLADARDALGWDRVEKARMSWESVFGSEDRTDNSYSSHLAEAMVWAGSEAPLEMFEETPSKPYRMRELMALKALSMHEKCVGNMCNGNTHDREFLERVITYRDWAETAAKAGDWESVGRFKYIFFDPVRKAFPDELKEIDEKTNMLIKRI